MDSDPPRLPKITRSKRDERTQKIAIIVDNSSPPSSQLDIKPLHLPAIKKSAKSTPRQIDVKLLQTVLQELLSSLARLNVDNESTGDPEQHDIQCEGCGAARFKVDRYKCLKCDDYDLCASCFDSRKETKQHKSGHAVVHYKLPKELFGRKFDNDGEVTIQNLQRIYGREMNDTSTCDGCKVKGFKGLRFKCDTCPDYDLCQQCVESGKTTQNHTLNHPVIVAPKESIPRIDVNDILYGENDYLGRGAFGAVYKAKWISKSLTVACKVIHVNAGTPKEIAASFFKELAAYRELSGAYILKMFGYAYQKLPNGDDKYMLIMEFLSRGSLAAVIHGTKKLSLEQKMKISFNIASGMRKLHQHHMIHRDIRPDNILITPTLTAKIGDMGIARAMEHSVALTLMGCVHFMPPEFYTRKYDQKLDVFTVGLTLNELFTETKHNFEDSTRKITLMKKSPVFPELISRCILTDPNQRPTALEIEKTFDCYCVVFAKVSSILEPNYEKLSVQKKNEVFLKFYASVHPEAKKSIEKLFGKATHAPATVLKPPPPAVVVSPKLPPIPDKKADSTTSIICPHCLTALICTDYKEGSKLKCPTCSKAFNQVVCPHCLKPNYWKNGDYKQGIIVACATCQAEFQQITCVHCSTSNVWKNANYNRGLRTSCCTCHKFFTHVNCPHCNGVNAWSDTNYKAGLTVVCCDCKKKFQHINCPHCQKANVYPNADFKDTRVCTCWSCKKDFNHVNCSHCNDANIFKEANFQQGKLYTCVSCAKKIQKVSCPNCEGSNSWLNGDFKQTRGVRCCSCDKVFHCVSCSHCKKASFFKNGDFKQGLVYRCASCQKIFQKVECPTCNSVNAWLNGILKQGQNGRCLSCKSKFICLNCPHCKASHVWGSDQYRQAAAVVCKTCRKPFHHINCVGCGVANFFGDGFDSGRNYRCHSCQVIFLVLWCPHCNHYNIWPSTYKHGAPTTCEKCNNRFQHVCCPHCNKGLYYKDCNYTQGLVTTHTSGCGNTFQQKSCPHCNKANYWKNADYTPEMTVTCCVCKKEF